MMTKWNKKYSPQKPSDFVCNIRAINEISDWVKKFNTNKKTKNSDSCVLLIGDHGVGKTTAVNVILNQYGFEPITLNFAELKMTKNIESYLDKLFNVCGIINVFTKKNNTNNAIVIDNIESLASSYEKSMLTTLYKINNVKWYCPIIYISNGKHSTLLTTLKKNIRIIRFEEPHKIQLKMIMEKIKKTENIEINHDAVNKIIEYVNYDIRSLIIILEDLCNICDNSEITGELLTKYINTHNTKDINMKLNKGTLKMIYEYKNISDCLKYYESEKVLLPITLHHHYLTCIIRSNCSHKNTYMIINKIANIISISDVLENLIYCDQNWLMHELYGIYSCATISYYLSSIGIKNYSNIKYLEFPTDLNKSTITKINKKNITKSDKYFNNMNVMDYLYMHKIIKHLIEKKNLDLLNDFMAIYGMTYDISIKSLLKIDKLEQSKIPSYKQKKKNNNNVLNATKMNTETHFMYKKKYNNFMSTYHTMLKNFKL